MPLRPRQPYTLTSGDESFRRWLGDRCNGEIDDGKAGDPAAPEAKT